MMGGNGGDLQTRALRYLYPEKIFQQFEGDNATWTQFDPRVEWLLELLLSARQQKVLVICSEAATAIALEEALRTREGIRGAVFHEGMSILERDKASAYFAQTEGGAQVLLCSEIGSEGRNFQFASHLVLFDLPLNPDLLEQRIGRLDRIGQQNTVEIHVPYLEGTAQRALQLWYHDGLDAFEQTCPTARPVFEAVRDELFELLAANTGDQAPLDALLVKTRELHEPLKARLEQGRDRLLEIHSSGGAAAQQLVDKLAAEDDDTGMISFALKMFDEIGVNQDDRGENALVLMPGDHMLVPSFPGLPQDGMTITFDRNTALSRDDMALLSWDHPMMRGGIDLILGSEIGATSVALLKNKALPIGSILLELIFVAESAAHPQLYRFMPPTPIRLLMDKNGQNLGEKSGVRCLQPPADSGQSPPRQQAGHRVPTGDPRSDWQGPGHCRRAERRDCRQGPRPDGADSATGSGQTGSAQGGQPERARQRTGLSAQSAGRIAPPDRSDPTQAGCHPLYRGHP